MPSTVTSEDKTLAHTAATALHVANERWTGAERVRERMTVPRYGDEHGTSSIDLLHASDSPTPGLTAYATIGISKTPRLVTQQGRPLGAELVAAAPTALDWFPKLVSTAAFCVRNDGWDCWPGAILPDLVTLYAPSATMQHLLLASPYLWGDQQPPTVELAATTVAWLQLVPIATIEAAYAEQHGIPALETQLEEHSVDVADLTRAPVVDHV